MASYDVEAIVLSARPFGESDKILSVLSLEEGRFDVIVKGARRPKNRNAAFAQQFFHIKMSVYRGRSIDTMNQGEIVNTFPKILSDIYIMASATYVLELVKSVTPEREKNEVIFRLLERTLKEYVQTNDPDIVTVALGMKLMAVSGFKPELMRCISCGKSGDLCGKFNVELSGLICDSCAVNRRGSEKMDQNTRMVGLKLLGQDYTKLRDLHSRDFDLAEVEKFVNSYVDSKIDKQINSRDFIYQVRELENNEK